MKIAHIINPVNVTKKSDLFIAQPVTFETMRRARDRALKHGLDVALYATGYDEDIPVMPDGFVQLPLLERSIMDVGIFARTRKLPLIKDILDRLYAASDAEYFIYTNVDIAVQEDFYLRVAEMIREGFDGFVINRRTISGHFTSVDEIAEMYADKGEKHPGYDCFVFRRDVYPAYDLGNACIGANWIGRVIIANVIANAERFKVFEDEYLTFHIGDDRSWKISEFSDFDLHNERLVVQLLQRYESQGLLDKKPLLESFLRYHEKQKEQVRQASMVKMHEIDLDLPADPGVLYGDHYKPSTAWDEPNLLAQDPVFVIGYPRSGTTLLQALVSTQPGFFSLPEVHFFSIVRTAISLDKDRIQPECMDKVVHRIRERIRFSTNAEAHIRMLAETKQLSPKMLYEAIIVDNVIDSLPVETIRSGRWLEKTPDNGLYLDVIFRFYPNAKVINIVRDPEKAILSRRKYFDGEAAWPVRRHVQKWLDAVYEAENYMEKKPGQVMTLRLEDLAANKLGEMQKVCDFLEISLDESALAGYKEAAKKYVMPWESWKADTQKDVSPALAERSEAALSGEDRKVLHRLAWYELVKFGYLEGDDAKYPADLVMEALESLASISLRHHPIEKFRAYKRVLKAYHDAKEVYAKGQK